MLDRAWTAHVAPTDAEATAVRAGDDIVPVAGVTMDRGFTLAAPPPQVLPWLAQLGKGRAGWYLPAAVERFVPRSHRALRRLGARWTSLAVGDVVPDYGRDAAFTVAIYDPPTTLVYASQRGRMLVSWSMTLTPVDTTTTRVHLRLRLGPVRHRRLVASLGGAFDLLTIAGMAAGLRERLAG